MSLEMSNQDKCVDSNSDTCISASKDKRVYQYSDNKDALKDMSDEYPISDKCDEVMSDLLEILDSDTCLLEKGVKKSVGCISSQFRKGDMSFKESMNRAWQIVKDIECV